MARWNMADKGELWKRRWRGEKVKDLAKDYKISFKSVYQHLSDFKGYKRNHIYSLLPDNSIQEISEIVGLSVDEVVHIKETAKQERISQYQKRLEDERELAIAKKKAYKGKTISEIENIARNQGISYGEYVARQSI